ncbi:MAG: hypothetical protein CVV64_15305 [Candidatus Wallbacteria bacterium HGW-Wallbacteria-1]|uniref:Uncharacterized protein n=1 Tax=Candidatus Wallbacteria bacterium HGW-Wallbacteria-1 TaxID=2013854 RepID=A0A2N1PLG8_9BACT|nr:MAG: hypothetical protein CVV64_15305 [Candidatus Wallbacteria bacterium HGW-Wallbacteria-1]
MTNRKINAYNELARKRKSYNFGELLNPSQIENGLYGYKFFYPVFHCGGLGLANRNLIQQIKDWAEIRKAVQAEGVLPCH